MKFIRPKFENSLAIEVRSELDEVVIYATPAGAKWLAEQLFHLSQKSNGDHLHLEDFQVLTTQSKKLTIGLQDICNPKLEAKEGCVP